MGENKKKPTCPLKVHNRFTPKNKSCILLRGGGGINPILFKNFKISNFRFSTIVLFLLAWDDMGVTVSNDILVSPCILLERVSTKVIKGTVKFIMWDC